MSKWMVVILKAILSTISTVTILLSIFLICLIFDLAFQNGMPPFENIRFSISLFFVITLLVFICFCLKTHLYISIDSRNQNVNKQIQFKD
ncbi:hypothetical protein DVQ18_20410 [Yersinia enterocolitica]|nr:hypothetical protein [Yersinia enterocolitica]EKN6328544.1 hypothetical protein [Yersinia enterocolitica]CQG98918.1 Uncharacterised protein [Yersinia mollaretii]